MKRKSLSQMARLKIFEAADGLCHICGQKIKAGEKWEAEHIIALALNGPDYDIRESNLAPVHIACHAIKTKDDRQRIAKAKRMKAKYLGIRRSGSLIAGSRGTKFKKHVDGGGDVEMSKPRKRVLHCWADGQTILEWMEANPDADPNDYVGCTCMLERDHDGPHSFTPDDQIGISFAPADQSKDHP